MVSPQLAGKPLPGPQPIQITNGGEDASIVRQGPTPSTDMTAGAVTLSPAQVLGGLFKHDPGGAVSDVLPAANDIFALLNSRGIAPALGLCWDLWYLNMADAAEAITVTAGDDLTLFPAALVIDQSETAMLHFVITALDTPTDANIDVYWVLGQAA